eukprot:764811-Hanusia_phi.AAC.2
MVRSGPPSLASAGARSQTLKPSWLLPTGCPALVCPIGAHIARSSDSSGGAPDYMSSDPQVANLENVVRFWML